MTLVLGETLSEPDGEYAGYRGGLSTGVEYVDGIDPGTGDEFSNINTPFARADKLTRGTRRKQI